MKHQETPGSMTVVQCWDDGVTADIRLIEVLRRHGAKATFNLNAGLHGASRGPAWDYKGTPVQRVAADELTDIYGGFTIANHSLTHPWLDRIPAEKARRDIAEGRERLQQLFQQPVRGFAYPYGAYNEAVMEAVRETGHLYARTVGEAARPFPPEDPMAFHPHGHFLADDFWARYEKARPGGVFYFWGHAYELISESMWKAFEETMERISADPQARWGHVIDLFQGGPG